MQNHKFNVVTDGQWGSTGKGLISSYLAWKHQPEFISTTNMPNAGHTAVGPHGEKFIAKALPAAAAAHTWGHMSLPDDIGPLDCVADPNNPTILIGPSAAFTIDQLMKEIEECQLGYGDVIIHPRAGVICESHRLAECADADGPKHIASTMQGCGTFLSEKILRKDGLKLARDYEELNGYIDCDIEAFNSSWSLQMLDFMQHGTILHEGSQGFSLDINFGSHFPHCTSRGTTAMNNAADMGISHSYMGDVYMVIRPYPIRVGNVIEDGKQVGYSGDCYDDHTETTWAEIAESANAPESVMKGELTTVTKRLRRVFTFSKKQIAFAVAANGANKIALNFANYVDYSICGTNDPDKLTDKVKDFIKMVEDVAGVPVTLIGTGPQANHVIDLEN